MASRATASDGAAAEDRLARRNALVLAAAQAVGGSAATIAFATGGLVGLTLMPEAPGLATLPITGFVVGTACGSVPAALVMRRVGRRPGFLLGALLSLLGGLAATTAIFAASFLGFLAATFLSGFAQAFVQQYRFAAADTASDAFKPKAVSWVLAGGIVAGVVGPQAVILTSDLFAPILFAGAYAAQAALAAASCLVLACLRIPRPPPRDAGVGGGRPIGTIFATARLRVAVMCGIVAYALMNLVMTAAPMAMVACGFSTAEAALGIQWHVIAMYGPSFFTGGLIARFGAERIAGVGLALLAGCGVVALAGIELAHFWTALILLGLGWNLAFVGATTIVVGAARPEERARVQATNDLLIFAAVALASFSSGKILDSAGWEMVNVALIAITAITALVLSVVALRGKAA